MAVTVVLFLYPPMRGKQKLYGSADPALAYSISAGNLVNGDTLALTRLAVKMLVLCNIVNAQYQLQRRLQRRQLRHHPAMLTVAANLQSKVYGTSDPA